MFNLLYKTAALHLLISDASGMRTLLSEISSRSLSNIANQEFGQYIDTTEGVIPVTIPLLAEKQKEENYQDILVETNENEENDGLKEDILA